MTIKKSWIITSIALTILATCFSAAVNAETFGAGTGFYTQLKMTQPTTDFEVVDLGRVGLWDVECTGTASVSSTNYGVTLTGNNSGKVWLFKSTTESTITDSTQWTVLGSLVDSINVPAHTNSNGNTQRLALQNVTARWLYIGYDTTLSSPGTSFANASGNGAINATAVPEPASIVALFCGCIGLFARFRKPKGNYKL